MHECLDGREERGMEGTEVSHEREKRSGREEPWEGDKECEREAMVGVKGVNERKRK